ncbi:MAG: histidine kinase, partial [Bacteroidota bacterium]
EKLKSPLVFTCSKSAVYAGYFSGSLARVNTNELNFIFNDSSDKYINSIFYDTITARLYIGNDNMRYIENQITHSLKVTTAGTCNIGFVRNKENIFSGAFSSLVKIAGDSTHRVVDFNTRINCIYSTEKDELLLGCIDGAYRYDAMNKKISLISPQFKDVRVDDIESLHGNLFFATQGNGLMILRKDGTVKTIDESQGLCSNIIRKFRVSGNKLWCASFNGMSEIVFTDFEKFEFNITNITVNEGLLSNEINDITTLNDTIWVASKKGISFFSTHTDFVNHRPPLVHFTTFQVNSIDTIFKDNYLFAHTLNTISIGFESPLFKSSGKQIYQYTLKNADDSIKGITTNRSVQFLSLRPGTYALNVKAMNNSGVWSVQPATLHFTILAPWWQTWLFRTIILVMIVAAGVSFYKSRLKKLSKKFDSERKQASLQLTAMRAQMNPHFIFNVMSSIRHYMQNNDMASAEKYLTSFAKLVRYTLDNSATQEVTLAEEMQALNNYATLEMQRVENGFDFEVHCDDDMDMDEIMVPSLLLQPFVENAIKHGIERSQHKKRILVEIKKHGDTVLIAIEDNGVGRNNASQWNTEHRETHTSFGTRLTFDRIESFNMAYNRMIKVQVIDLGTNQSDSTGTRVEIVL